MNLTRREALRLVIGSPLYVQSLMNSPSAVVSSDKSQASQVNLIREWSGPICRSRLVNEGRVPVRVKEVVLFDLKLDLAADTRLYAEGFQMLSQTDGTVGSPVAPGSSTAAQHYKTPMQRTGRGFYRLFSLSPI